MKDVAERLLVKADRALATAEQLVRSGDTDFAVARAYYAMFYAAEALLSEKGLRFRKHGGVHGAFGEHFAKTGLFDPKYHQWLLAAFEKRIIADYEVEEPIGADEARTIIQHAHELLQAVRQYLGGS